MGFGGQGGDLVAQPVQVEAAAEGEVDLRRGVLVAPGFIRDFHQIERRIQLAKPGDAFGQCLGYAALHVGFGGGIDLAAVGRGDHIVQGVCQIRGAGDEACEGGRQVGGQCGVAQEPQRTAQDEPRRVENHLGLQCVFDLVVERFDGGPQREQIEGFPGGEVGADDLGHAGAGFVLQPADEGCADAVDHAVDDVGGDDLALERVALDLLGVALTQRDREVAEQGLRDVGVFGDVRCEDGVVNLDLAVGQQDRELGRYQAAAGGLAFGDFLVEGQEFEFAVEAPGVAEFAHEAGLFVEEF